MVTDVSSSAEQQQQHGSYDSRLPPYPVAGSRSNPGSSDGSAAEGSGLRACRDVDMDTDAPGGRETVSEEPVKAKQMAAEQMSH